MNKFEKLEVSFSKITHFNVFSEIPTSSSLLLEIDTSSCRGTDTEVNYLEHVQAVITANSTRRGDLEMFLTSPMGTRFVKITRMRFLKIILK